MRLNHKSTHDIILDRDGVINLDSDQYVKNAEQWIPITGSIDAIVKLHQAGYRVFVATNQSGIGRGLFTLDDLQAMHSKMMALVAQAGGKITDIAFCPHSPEDDCACRKPKPGLLTDLAQRNNIALPSAIVIGDSLRDLQAAVAVNAQAMLVLTGKGQTTKHQNPTLSHPTFETLNDAVTFILS
ncbi:MAG: D-glycero-beta-D-manno-heptose 1,7-bisphosphate 7-phosphatase [Cycloclasticus sp.]|nr:D-glycero-beta-D-manno-heptose 1,7-bisphosphate 7-phosphatase [Cycloclasticus sp.]MBQ0789753.1 D-glycero-beta-D-manno-heptose 1,7-bisphosphate 7-phosphatase [Cycloclasticus sp.]